MTGMASKGGQFYLAQAWRDVTQRRCSLSDRYCGMLANCTFPEQGTTLIIINYHCMCTRDTRSTFKRIKSKSLSTPRHVWVTHGCPLSSLAWWSNMIGRATLLMLPHWPIAIFKKMKFLQTDNKNILKNIWISLFLPAASYFETSALLLLHLRSSFLFSMFILAPARCN